MWPVVKRRALGSSVLALWLGTLALGSACGGKSSQQTEGTGGSSSPGGAGGSSGATGGTAASGAAGTSAGSGAGVAGAEGGTAGSRAGAGAGGGESGEGAVAGTGGTSGAGTAGSGAAAGMAGAATWAQPECETAADCTLQNDCCGCHSIPKAARVECVAKCEGDPCVSMGIGEEDVQCLYGRCIFARSCGYDVLCSGPPPECPEGTRPSIVQNCWGPCLPPTECMDVPSCDDCGDAFCVQFAAMRSSFHCVSRVDTCDRENYCECLGVCGACTEEDDSVVCPCLAC